MKEGKASRTADIAVIMRANHSRLPDHERVIYDPLAKRFLTGSYKILHALSRSRLIHNVLWMYSERVGPGTYGWTLARHRFFDDCLRRCIEDVIDQLVILGAGYDARAYRFENL
ncbi:MAG: class I SAM-dependent methyltransferase, partial [bacterium]